MNSQEKYVEPRPDFGYTKYREQAFEDSEEYRDYITDRLHDAGIVVQQIVSKRGQFRVGENKLGLEIKLDRKFWRTGNLCIEVAEKAVPRPGDYVPSGIFRDDNSWLFGIGNKDWFYIFSQKYVRACYQHGTVAGKPIRHYTRDTSKGFLLDHETADKVAELIFKFDQGQVLIVKGGEGETHNALKRAIPDPQRKLF